MAKGKKKSAKKRDIKSEQKSEEVVADKSLNIPLKTEGLAIPKSGLEPSKGSEDLVLKHKVFHMPALANDIYITRNKPLIVYQKRLEKLFFNLNYQAVKVYATGAAINTACKLILYAKRSLGCQKEPRIITYSVPACSTSQQVKAASLAPIEETSTKVISALAVKLLRKEFNSSLSKDK
ncbi:unnamed protein product [Moneuplotes crassus]|uniref:DNA/RNA-binding protein Alba-like domain-containing protein n=1 Tax=Euplotes crassus TaxID=5936 RepID=A0AAD1XY45_EUPCR|nr:unnamed protein product [Moneuplotes crassus]